MPRVEDGNAHHSAAPYPPGRDVGETNDGPMKEWRSDSAADLRHVQG